MWDRWISRWPTKWASAGLALLMLLTLGLANPSSSTGLASIAPLVLEETAEGGETSFLVILREQADLSEADQMPTREARGQFVVGQLRETAERTQRALRVLLDRRGIPYQPFYIANMLAVTGDRALVMELAARPEVERVDANPTVRADLPEIAQAPLMACPAGGVEWNVTRVNADDVWELGYTGEGVVVAGQDTGYDWDHPALINQYRGWNGSTASHDYNWHDAIHSGGGSCGADSPEPCDDYGHGTHTMGTIVGNTGTYQIGIAPDAQWIGCRNMNVGDGTPATYSECFEFFVAPYPLGSTPAEGDPAMAPHVINNSWSCPASEGCTSPDILQTVVENTRAAGIMVVVSASNAGPGCSTVSTPAAIYDASFSIGATNSSDDIASFSARGPVTVDGSNRLKPEVSAPGVSICSTGRNGTYYTSQGTSMAAPHVAGVAALVWSAAPDLIGDVDASELVITSTAQPQTTAATCGDDQPGDVPNNVFGWGIVDALAAVKQVWLPMTVTKQASLNPGFPSLLTYDLIVSNTAAVSLTGVVLSDTLPTGTPLAWASGVYTEAGGDIIWAPGVIDPYGHLTATLVVTVAHLPSGSLVANEQYGARADDVIRQAVGTPVESTIPWFISMPIILQE